MKLTYSQIAAFLKCRKSWQYAYVDNITPRVDVPHLQLGTLVHVYLENKLVDNDGIKAVNQKFEEYINSRRMFDEEIKMYRQTMEHSIDIGERAYQNFIKRYQVLKGYVEYRFDIPIIEGVNLVGKIDAVVKDLKTKTLWILDHKTRKTFQSTENEELNLQNAIYQKALAIEGIQTIGSICHQIYNEMPSVPTVNKNGTMSKALIKTDWQTYSQYLAYAGLDQADYQEMQAKLENVEFFNFLKAYRNETELENTWNEIIIPTAKEILETEEFIRSLSVWNCQGCRYRDLCLTELRGIDSEYLREHNFISNSYMSQYEDSKNA